MDSRALLLAWSPLAMVVSGCLTHADAARINRVTGTDRRARAAEVSKKTKDKGTWTIVCADENFSDTQPTTILSAFHDRTFPFSEKASLSTITDTRPNEPLLINAWAYKTKAPILLVGKDGKLTEAVAERTCGASLDWGHPMKTTGKNYADAPAAGALAGRNGVSGHLGLERGLA